MTKILPHSMPQESDMIKVVIILIIVLCIVYIGYRIKTFLWDRIVYFEDVIKLCDRYLSNLDFKKEKLSKFLSDNLDDLKCKKDVLDATNGITIDGVLLSSKEKEKFQNLVGSFGKYDTYNERSNVGLSRAEFIEIRDKCRANYDRYGMLIFKLSIIVALLIVILLI